MTGIKIETFCDAKLNAIAQKCDKNQNGKLQGEEYQLFAQEASKQGVDYKTISDTLSMNALERWYFDVDKISTDGNDDGKLSFGEKVESLTKGLAGGIIKGIAKHPLASVAGIAAGVGLTVLTGGAIIPAMVAVGAVSGGVMVAKGAIQASKATTDGEAKAAWEGIGTGTAVLGLSAVGVKGANKAAAKAGVKSLQGLENESWRVNVVEGIKALPESFKVSGLNTKGNVLTWASSIKGDKVIYANSNKMRSFGPQEGYMSKANDVQAYRFNPNGTEEEVLANNPGVFAKDGKFYVPNKWNPQEPYLIDPSKEQMIMLYGGDDMAVCDGGVFKASYVNTAKFKENGALDYVEPSAQNYGEVLSVTKQAPGSFQVAPEGTKIMTLEGQRTLKAGEVIAYDAQGNPYATPVKNILKRNTGLSANAMSKLAEVDPVAVELHTNPDGILSRIPAQYQKEAMPIILEERKAWAALQEASDGNLDARIEGLKFRIELQGGREVVVKNRLLNKMGVKLIYGYNDYNGPDPLLGFAYQGKMYPLSSGHGLCLGEAQNAINGILDKIASGNLPKPVTEFYVDITQNGYYFK